MQHRHVQFAFGPRPFEQVLPRPGDNPDPYQRLIGNRQRAFQFVHRRQRRRLPMLLRPLVKSARIDAAQHAMRGQNLQPRRVHIDEGHHDVLRRRIAVMILRIRERRLIAVMPVGDQQLLVAHQRLDHGHVRRRGDRPHAMPGLILVEHVQNRRAFLRGCQQRVDGARRVRVQHENLAKVRAGVIQQFAAVFLGTGQRLLMPIDDVC